LPANVVALADAPSLQARKRPEVKAWEVDQLVRFLDAIGPHRMAPAFYFAAHTGMRRGEVLGVRWRDLDLEAGRVSVRQALVSVAYEVTVSDVKTGTSRRTINIDDDVVRVLRDWHKTRTEERDWMKPAADDLVRLVLQVLLVVRPAAAAPDRGARRPPRRVAEGPIRRTAPTSPCPAERVGESSGWLPDRPEERDQCVGDGPGRDRRGEVADAGQFAHVRVGDVLGDVAFRVGVEGGAPGLLSPQQQDRHGDLREHVGIGGPRALVGLVRLQRAQQRREGGSGPLVVVRIQGSQLVVAGDEGVERTGRIG
jgi:hypothetical protein